MSGAMGLSHVVGLQAAGGTTRSGVAADARVLATVLVHGEVLLQGVIVHHGQGALVGADHATHLALGLGPSQVEEVPVAAGPTEAATHA